MNRIFKRGASMFLSLLLTYAACNITPALAVSESTGAMTQENEGSDTHQAFQKYQNYKLEFKIQNKSNTSTAMSSVSALMSNAKIEKTQNFSGVEVKTLDNTPFKQYIPNCESIIAVEELNGHSFISYKTVDNEHVILDYVGNVLNAQTIYSAESDQLVQIFPNNYVVTDDFLKSAHYELTTEQLDVVENAFSSNDINSLKDIEGIQITESNGQTIVEPIGATATASYPTNYKSPETQFAPYTKKQVSSSSVYISALKAYKVAKVLESMNNYAKKSVDHSVFYVGTGLSAIAAFLGGPMTGAVAAVTMIGVAISAYMIQLFITIMSKYI